MVNFIRWGEETDMIYLAAIVVRRLVELDNVEPPCGVCSVQVRGDEGETRSGIEDVRPDGRLINGAYRTGLGITGVIRMSQKV